jgi:general stress protein CsbA
METGANNRTMLVFYPLFKGGLILAAVGIIASIFVEVAIWAFIVGLGAVALSMLIGLVARYKRGRTASR